MLDFYIFPYVLHPQHPHHCTIHANTVKQNGCNATLNKEKQVYGVPNDMESLKKYFIGRNSRHGG